MWENGLSEAGVLVHVGVKEGGVVGSGLAVLGEDDEPASVGATEGLQGRVEESEGGMRGEGRGPLVSLHHDGEPERESSLQLEETSGEVEKVQEDL